LRPSNKPFSRFNSADAVMSAASSTGTAPFTANDAPGIDPGDRHLGCPEVVHLIIARQLIISTWPA
jgi:hypothetical protein